jgi:hypothetical protein
MEPKSSEWRPRKTPDVGIGENGRRPFDNQKLQDQYGFVSGREASGQTTAMLPFLPHLVGNLPCQARASVAVHSATGAQSNEAGSRPSSSLAQSGP